MPGIINKCKELRVEDDGFRQYEGKPKNPIAMKCPQCGFYNSCLRCEQGYCEECGLDIYKYLANKENGKR